MTFEFSDQDRTLDVHHYDANGDYTHTTPGMLIRAGEGLPASATILGLPGLVEGEAAKMNEALTAWAVVADNRGDIAYAKDPDTHQDYAITEAGDVPSTHTLLERTSDDHEWSGSAWVVSAAKTAATLAQAKTEREAAMRKECETAIMGGFSSNALATGRAFYYGSDRDDQQNLTSAITALEVNGGTFMVVCNDPDTQDGFIEREHTEAQAKKVKADFATFRLGRSQHLTTKIAEINTAANVAAVNAVNW